MESIKPKTMKEAPEAKIQKTTKQELMDELKAKQSQLDENKVRLEGGISPSMNSPVMSIDKEKKLRERMIKKMKIELQFDQPVRPKYRYEDNEEYRTILKEEKQELIEEQEKVLKKLEEQKEWIIKSNAECKARIEVLKKEISKAPEPKKETNEATG